MAEHFATGVECREITKRGQPLRIDISKKVGFIAQISRIDECNAGKNDDSAISVHRDFN
jgi:hypothetical protein